MTDGPKLCGVCGIGLTGFHNDGGTRWGHVTEQDHPAVPVLPGEVPARPKCDFCATQLESPEEVWTYVTVPFQTEGGGITFDHNEPWAACEPCHDDIQQDRMGLVTERAVQALIDANPLYQSEREFVTTSMHELHQAFVTHVEGQPFHGYPDEYEYRGGTA